MIKLESLEMGGEGNRNEGLAASEAGRDGMFTNDESRAKSGKRKLRKPGSSTVVAIRR